MPTIGPRYLPRHGNPAAGAGAKAAHLAYYADAREKRRKRRLEIVEQLKVIDPIYQEYKAKHFTRPQVCQKILIPERSKLDPEIVEKENRWLKEYFGYRELSIGEYNYIEKKYNEEKNKRSELLVEFQRLVDYGLRWSTLPRGVSIYDHHKHLWT